MENVNPGQTTILSESGLPSGVAVGFQVIRAANGTVAVAWTNTGVIERPLGSGNYVITFVAPVEGDLYLVVIDWNNGVLTPETTRVVDLKVTSEVLPGTTGLGAVADYVHMLLGGETWKGLTVPTGNYGEGFVVQAIELVKEQIFQDPPAMANEHLLPKRVLHYVAICAALQLIPAAIDFWGSQITSKSVGNDPTEVVTYVNRANLMKDLRDELMRQRVAAQAAALPLIDLPILRDASDGPAIDEDDDMHRATADPRDFPTADEFPFHADGGRDAYGRPLVPVNPS